jgi:tRNA dimethylallyltransferase
MKALPKVIIITGPTGSGKTELSLKLAKKIGGGIISADSRQIYKGMNIGTAKATKKELKSVPHHLIDIKNPDQDYSLAQFKIDALFAIEKIASIGKIPIVVGGTGLYIYALINNLEIPKVKPDKHLRKRLEKQIQRFGLNYLFGKLTALDPESAYIIDPKNPRRVIRALEIALTTKKPFSKQRKSGRPLFDRLLLGITVPKTDYERNLKKRNKAMVKAGLLGEVKKLVKKYGYRRIPFDAIGYREIISYLQGKITLPDALKLIDRNMLRFAKRQMTWFRKMPVVWVKTQGQAERKIKKFLSK